MRQTSIYLNDEVFEEIKRLAKEDGRSFNSMLVRLVLKGLSTLDTEGKVSIS